MHRQPSAVGFAGPYDLAPNGICGRSAGPPSAVTPYSVLARKVRHRSWWRSGPRSPDHPALHRRRSRGQTLPATRPGCRLKNGLKAIERDET